MHQILQISHLNGFDNLLLVWDIGKQFDSQKDSENIFLQESFVKYMKC